MGMTDESVREGRCCGKKKRARRNEILKKLIVGFFVEKDPVRFYNEDVMCLRWSRLKDKKPSSPEEISV